MTPTPAAPRIVAVVVTFNRVGLLKRLVPRLREIAGLDQIIVVDNASTDGTPEWLAAAAQEPGTLLHAHLMTTNTGGAGGFHDGLQAAIEGTDADLVWLMDDDGLPDPDCLATLLQHADPSTHRQAQDGAGSGEPLDFWGPVVVDEKDPERLVFPIRLPGSTAVVHDRAAVSRAARDGRLDDIVIPFNGILVTRTLVEKIGYPRAEFFIWGDDHEYRLRAEKAGARIATITDAVVRHPSVGELGTPMAFGRTTYNHTPSDLKHYCMARNNVVNLRDYRGWLFVLAFVLKTLWFYAFTRPSVKRLRLSAEGIAAGVRNDFSGHQRFLS